MFLIAGHAPHVAWTQLEPPRGARRTRRTPICNLFDNDYAVAPHIDCRYVAPEPVGRRPLGSRHVRYEIVVLVVGEQSDREWSYTVQSNDPVNATKIMPEGAENESLL